VFKSLAFLPFCALYIHTRCILFDCHVLCALNPFVKSARVRRVVVKLHNIFIYYSLLFIVKVWYGMVWFSIHKRIRDFVMTCAAASIMHYLCVLFFLKNILFRRYKVDISLLYVSTIIIYYIILYTCVCMIMCLLRKSIYILLMP